MSEDARIAIGLPAHPKTKKLIRRLGEGGAWFLVRLFLWAAHERPDGVLTGMSEEDIELAVDWTGEEGAFVAALLAVGFLDGVAGNYAIHDWRDHNPWAAGADLRSAKARWNAIKRHHGEQEADRQVPEWASYRRSNDAGSSASSSAGRNAEANSSSAERNAPSPSPSPSPSPTERERETRARAGSPEDGQLPEGVDPERWADYRAQLDDDGKLSISRIKTALLQLRRVIRDGHDPNAVLRAAVMRGLRDLEDTAQRLARERAPQPSARDGPARASPSSRQAQAIAALNEVTARVTAEPSARLASPRIAGWPAQAGLPEP